MENKVLMEAIARNVVKFHRESILNNLISYYIKDMDSLGFINELERIKNLEAASLSKEERQWAAIEWEKRKLEDNPYGEVSQ